MTAFRWMAAPKARTRSLKEEPFDSVPHRAGSVIAEGADRPQSIDAHLWRIAACESGTNPRAVNPSGRYRGAWQWDLATYARWGGVGDPIDAPLSVQLVVARATYVGQGPGSWPVCQYR